MRLLRLFVTVILVLSVGAWILPAPLALSQSDLTLRFNEVNSDNFPEIQTTVTVVDSHGIPIAGLDQAAFQASEEGQSANPLAVKGMPGESFSLTVAFDVNDTIIEGNPVSKCRLCGCRLRATEHLVRLSGELFHVSCAEPALRDSSAWREREVGTLNQLVAGIGRATVV